MNKRTKDYLARKQLGGEINQRGNDYEQIYTCFRIMEFILRYPENLHNIYLSSQYAASIDDLHIDQRIPGKFREIFHQLKTSAKLDWKNGEHSLFFDFREQVKILRQKQKAFQLLLIVSNDGVYRAMKEAMPTKLKRYSQVKHFPWFGSLNAHCVYHKKFREMAERLCAFSDADKINAIVKSLLAGWICTDKKNVPLSQILNSALVLGRPYLRSSVPTLPQDQALTILNNIAGFSFMVQHGYFKWKFAHTDSGQILYPIDSPEFRNIEQEIIAKRPTTFDALELIIS